MDTKDGLAKSLKDVFTSKEADTVWACAFAALGGATIFNALKESMPLSITFMLSGMSLISLVPFFLLRKTSKRTGDLPSTAVSFVSFLSPMILMFAARLTPAFHSNAWVSLGIYIVGISLFFASLTFLGSNFGVLPAFRGVSTGGPYSLVRHPMYLGELLEFIGIVIAFSSILTIIVLFVIIVLLVVRIRFEEKVLLLSEEYAAYSEKVRYRFIPKIW